jgi:hypothetical protein
MILQVERFINEVFDNCVQVIAENHELTSERVIGKTFTAIESGNNGYWQKKNVTESLNILERMKLVSGRVEPEFTPHLRFLLEVRHGQLTTWGRIFAKLPNFARVSLIYLYRRIKSVLSILGVLSFVHLSKNAYEGAQIVSGWLGYAAGFVLCYLLYLGIRKLIN